MNIPFLNHINLKEDTFIEKKLVKLLNRKGQEYSRHLVETYEINGGKHKNSGYHIFTYIDEKAVMNYTLDDYYRLSEYIDISFNYTIFQKYDGEILEVPIIPDYRASMKGC